MTRDDYRNLIPATEEALRRGISRERLVREIQMSKVEGVRLGNRWFVVAGGPGQNNAAAGSGSRTGSR
jgi:hypothetical protein